MNETPTALGYRMPAEWEPHAAMWLAWPYNPLTWEDHLEGAEETYRQLIHALVPHETVHVLVPDATIGERARRKLHPLSIHDGRLQFHTIETGDVWFRDYGPLFVVRKKAARRHATSLASDVAWTKWIYNALGGKYDDLLIGNDVPDRMPIRHLPKFDAGIVLEGGSIDVNGTGSLLTTESCLLSPDRNPGLARHEIEQRLKDFLGITNVLWLSRGIAGDDTTGHVDDVARFVGRKTVVAAVEGDPADENFSALQENLQRLRGVRNERGEALRIVPLPMPRPFEIGGRRMAASYANFSIANRVVLVPTYRQTSDAVAVRTLQKLFPDREVIGLDCYDLVFGYGALHCITMQEPAQGTRREGKGEKSIDRVAGV